MKYQSTRGENARVTAAEAIVRGLSADGGLFVPESFPLIEERDISNLLSQTYAERASYIIGAFLDGFKKEKLNEFTDIAYSQPSFDHAGIAPLRKTDGITHFLELWHGPTCAFKDMALQIMPRLFIESLKAIGENRKVCILVATSGDTGKAALEGYRDVQGTSIVVFYPKNGVSDVQELQMTSQRGGNVKVVAVKGNFDDAQRGAKTLFSDSELSAELDKNGYFLSSANSINWGRLVPQIAYYVSAYCDLINSGELRFGDKVNFCVPTGNFGNILAAYYALRIGLPVNKLICASNRNDVLTQFIETGVYDRNRAFYTTMSPSMDILVSSNLERLLFELSDKDGDIVASYMTALLSGGKYDVPVSVLGRIRESFASGFCSEEDTLKIIAATWNEHNYLIDTHTAVACKTLSDYRARSGDDTMTVIVSTASPFKFPESVLSALGVQGVDSGIQAIALLAGKTGLKSPAPLSELTNLTPRFNEVINIKDMKALVLDFCNGFNGG